MPWAIIPAVIAGGAAIYSASKQSSAANKAADAQRFAADQQAQVTWDMYNQSRKDMEPYQRVGQEALYSAFGYEARPTTYYPPGTSGNALQMDPALAQQLGYTAPQQAAQAQPQTRRARGGRLGDNRAPQLSKQEQYWQAVGGSSGPYARRSNIGNNALGTGATGAAPAQPVTYMGYAKTGEGIDPTGGASQYLNALSAMNPNVANIGGLSSYAVEPRQHFINSGQLSTAVQPGQEFIGSGQASGQLPPGVQPGWEIINSSNGTPSYRDPSTGRLYPVSGADPRSLSGTPQSVVQPGQQQFQAPGGVDPTGGAGQYRDALAQIDPNVATDYMQALKNLDPAVYTDITGGASKYKDQLEALEFKLNPTDDVYKWRQAQTEKTINQAAAARGVYNSRPTINALSDANMALQESEIGRQYGQFRDKQAQLQNLYNMAMQTGNAQYAQDVENLMRQQAQQQDLYNMEVDNWMRNYAKNTDLFNQSAQLGATKYSAAVDEYNRQYGKNIDLYNMATQTGQLQYGKALDAIKAGQGAAQSMGTNAMNTGAQLSSVYGNLGNANASNALWQGQNTANIVSGLTNTGLNALAAYNMYKPQTTNANSWMDNYSWSRS